MNLTDGQRLDAAIETSWCADTFELCQEIVNTGGHIANVGVHGKITILHLEKCYGQRI